ncbi:hypothetical protein ALQ73_00434, partial [Pseudomonas savastanoi pv. glycinea]
LFQRIPRYARTRSSIPTASELITAVENFVAKGGIIAVIPDGEMAGASNPSSTDTAPTLPDGPEHAGKLEQLKYLAAKGAGFTALQYSLRMNKKDLRQLATENGVTIAVSQPMLTTRRDARHDTTDIDDVVAGHAMHYSALGYTAAEIAQVLDLSLRQVWNIGKAYRFEFRQQRDSDTP